MILASEPAAGAAALAAAGRTDRVRYSSTSVRGAPTTMTGLVHLPPGTPPPCGWPIVTYGHMTSGGGDSAAPSLATANHPELQRMTQGDAFVARLLERGCAVVRPDYEGIGGPGPHPYLIGRSLARAVIDLAVAAHADNPLSGAWVSAGHSEGAVAAMWAAAIAHDDVRAAGLDLRAVCAFTPVTRMDVTIGAALRMPVALPGCQVVSALIGLMLSGATTTDARLADLLDRGDGLSPAARSVWGHLGERCLTELCADDSWGAIAPARILGPAGAEVRSRLLASFRANEVAALRFPPGLPMRVEASWFDEVAPCWLTRRAMSTWRRGGVDLTTRWWHTTHSPVLRADRAPAGAADWTARQLTSG